MTSNKYVLGITGGVGSGKSMILEYLNEKYHAEIIILDDIAKQLWLPGGICYDRIKELFGEEAVLPAGILDRSYIAAKIFKDESLRKDMNDIVHPEVRKITDEIIAGSDRSFIVIESAILIESGFDTKCDELWYIYASEKKRAERLRSSRDYSDERIKELFNTQLSDEGFRNGCDIVIDNNGDFKDTIKQIDKRIEDEILQYCQRQQR